MGAKNVLRLWKSALVNATQIDLASGDTMSLLPEVDDQGSIEIGDGSTDMDFKVFLGATTSYVEFNVGAGQVNVEGAEVHLGDGDLLEFGDAAAGDFTIGFDGTQLEILPTTGDTGAVNFGDGTTDADVKIFLGSATEHVLFDVGNSKTTITGTPVDFATTGRTKWKINALVANTTLNTTHFGGVVTTRGGSGALIFTLPAAASNSGEWAKIINVADQDLTIAGAAGELVVFNDAAANSVAFSTASEKIGGAAEVISDGTSWLVFLNLADQGQNTTIAT